jgi:hypothetical protein
MILQPPSVLLVGPAGSGKTSAIATQLLAGLEVFVVVTEPDGVSSLLDSCERLKASVDKLHWRLCAPAAAGWMELEDMILKISTMDQKQLADQRDMGKAAFRPAAQNFLRAFSNFTCDRTGEQFGDFTRWDDTRSLVIDSLTGWSMIGFGCTVGFKPTANPGEWGIAQNFVFNMLTKINADRRCFFTMTAHLEKEMDELQGIRKLMVSTIGAKLAPKIPPFFGEVIKCERVMLQGDKAKFNWSTIDNQMDLKNRALPISNNLPPDFAPVVAAYRRRLQLAAGTPQSSPPATPEALPKVVPPSAPMSPSKATQPGVL